MQSAIHLAKRFVELGEHSDVKDMTPMKLLKLVYIAHGWMLGLTGKSLIFEDVEAWKYGPVIPELYGAIKAYKNQPVPISFFNHIGEHGLDEVEDHIVNQVFEIYGDLSGVKLSALTHREGTPWSETWAMEKVGVIRRNLIQSYYQNLSDNG